jgi:hypothetical protein
MKKIQKITIFQENNILKFAKTKILNKDKIKIKETLNAIILETYLNMTRIKSYNKK